MSDHHPGHTFRYAVEIETAYWDGGWHAHLVGQFSQWTEPSMATEAEAISIIQGKLTNVGVTLLPYEATQ